MIKLLFETKGQHPITSNVVRAAAKNAFAGLKIIDLLLKKCEDEIQITPNVVTAAAGNWRSGDDLVRMQLRRYPREVQVTHEVLVAAVKNEAVRKETLDTLIAEQST